MRKKIIVLFLLIVLVLLGSGLLFVNECADGGGMGAAYKSCDCSGRELVLIDRTAADGPRRTICFGIVQSTSCYLFMGGPRKDCD